MIHYDNAPIGTFRGDYFMLVQEEVIPNGFYPTILWTVFIPSKSRHAIINLRKHQEEIVLWNYNLDSILSGRRY